MTQTGGAGHWGLSMFPKEARFRGERSQGKAQSKIPHWITSDPQLLSSLTPLPPTPTSNPSATPVAPPQIAPCAPTACPDSAPARAPPPLPGLLQQHLNRLLASALSRARENFKILQWLPIPLGIKSQTLTLTHRTLSCHNVLRSFHCLPPAFLLL